MESSHFISTNCSQCESTSSKEANCMSLTVYFALGVAMSLLICICIKVNSAQLCCITNGRSRSRHLRTLIAAAHSCQCERPFNQWSCLRCTLAVWTFSLIITFKSLCVLSLACSVDRGMYLLSLSFKMSKALFKRSDIYEFLSLYLILLFYFRTYTYPLPVSASLSLPVKLVFCFLSSQCVRLTQRGMKSIFYVSYSRKSPPSSRLSLCSGPVIMKVN